MIKVITNKYASSPYSRKGIIVLEEKGLPYEQKNIDPEFLPDGFGSMNPNLRASLLIDQDQMIFESDNIVDYLLRTYPGERSADAPDPPLTETMTRPDHHIHDSMILVTIETILNSANNISFFATSGIDPAKIEPYGWIWQRDKVRIDSCMTWLDQQATHEGFVPGVFSIMDLKMMCAFRTLTRCANDDWNPDWSKYRNLDSIYAFYRDRPSIVKTDPGLG